MAYCRFGDDSDVYLYEDVRGGWSCIWCGMVSDATTGAVEIRLDTIEATIAHLKQHIEFGHKVPEEAIQELEEEALD